MQSDIASTISGGAIAGASTLSTGTLITNAIQTMTYAKTKIAIITAAAAGGTLALAAAAGAAVGVEGGICIAAFAGSGAAGAG